MKRIITMLASYVCAAALSAQEVNRDLYQDYVPLPSFVHAPSVLQQAEGALGGRPEFVNNAETKYYPPVFNQVGGSCGSSSNEGYNFTYEMNALLDRDGSLPENQFPSHWIYLLAYQHTDRDDVLLRTGLPSAATYGGRTYSSVFGEQDCKDDFSGRMQGYDKWYSAMFNRAIRNARFRYDLSHEEGREELKQWLWNHQGDTLFHSGGVACVGVAITDSKLADIPTRTANRKAGASGKKYIKSWGPTYDHSVTIVGYDDRIEFDLNGDHKYDEDEKGAWIICNSWGTGWANKGFVYCPYKYSYAILTDQHPMEPYKWLVRKYYKPRRVLRITMDYSHRAEIQLMAGVSENLAATKPDYTQIIPMFNYDGNPQNVSPAPAVPMLGKWADGKMHHEPIEFGYDVTDLTDKADPAKPLKYFLQINTNGATVGSGSVRELCLMDYEKGEVPDTIVGLRLGDTPVEIAGSGKTTFVTVEVEGQGAYRPNSPACKTAGVLSWQKPNASTLTLQHYLIYTGGLLTDSVGADVLSYTLPQSDEQRYLQVAAVYNDEAGRRFVSKLTDAVSNVVKNTTQRVTLTCDVDGTYLALLRGFATTGRLATLDLGKARIVEGGMPYEENEFTSNDEVGDRAFYKATKLKSITLPEHTLNIGEQAFSNCDLLASIVIPDEVVSVGKDAFAYCPVLAKVTVGSAVQKFSQGAFYGSKVSVVYAKPMTPPLLSVYSFNSKPTIHVYADALEDYQNSDWANYGTLVGDLDDIIPHTAIDALPALETSDDAYYDMSGRRVTTPMRKGIYIRKGKKVLY